jgi:hypothetical protein
MFLADLFFPETSNIQTQYIFLGSSGKFYFLALPSTKEVEASAVRDEMCPSAHSEAKLFIGDRPATCFRYSYGLQSISTVSRASSLSELTLQPH